MPDGTPCQILSYLNVEKEGNDWYLLHDDGTQLGVQKEGCLYFEQCYYPWEDRLTFWGGGCDTRRMLTEGTPEEIKKHVRDLLDIWTPHGGYVFQQVHNIQANVPPENIVAMFDAIREFESR